MMEQMTIDEFVVEPVRRPKFNQYEAFKKYEVKADSVEDFLKRYTKHDRHYGRGKEYADCRIKSNTEHLQKFGYTFITHHDSVTGETVSYYEE